MGIYPRAQCNSNEFSPAEIQDFENELRRVEKVFNRTPLPSRTRPLGEIARFLTSKDRQDFLLQGNTLLVYNNSSI